MMKKPPFMFCIVSELPSIKSSKARLAVDDEAGVESNHLVIRYTYGGDNADNHGDDDQVGPSDHYLPSDDWPGEKKA